MSDRDIAILGAGPAGLAAAYRLARAGRPVVVLERAPNPGGLAGSFEVAGVRVDHGSHRLHPSCAPPIMKLLRELLGDDLQRRVRHGRVRIGGRWVAFPPRPADLIRNLPPRFALGVARDTATARWRHPPREDTFAEVVRAGLGPTMAEGFYDPYVRKIWGRDPSRLSGELARRRVGARSAGALWRKLARPSARSPEARAFYYPKRGYGSIVERLADAAVDAGAKLELGADVTALDTTGPGAQVHLAGGATVTAGQAWSTLPLPVLARIARPAAPPQVLTAAGRLSFRALALVYLAVARPHYTEFDAHYFPDLDVPFSRVSEPKNYRDGTGTDPADHTVLCAEVPCSVGDEIWTAADAALGERVASGLAAQGLPDATTAEVVVRRVPHAYPSYGTGYETDFARLDRWSRAQPDVLSFGRQGLFAHDNTHHALAMGWAAVDAIGPDGRVDPVRWGAARAAFREHVVED
ncbi:MAG: protoporphyrinogen/coproporphyrinogen oxidase [Acidimicrobiia bacterium]